MCPSGRKSQTLGGIRQRRLALGSQRPWEQTGAASRVPANSFCVVFYFVLRGVFLLESKISLIYRVDRMGWHLMASDMRWRHTPVKNVTNSTVSVTWNDCTHILTWYANTAAVLMYIQDPGTDM